MYCKRNYRVLVCFESEGGFGGFPYMIIRQARLDDATDIACIHVETWRDTYAGIVPANYLDRLSIEQRQNRWTAILTRSTDKTIVLTDTSERVVGWASYGPSRDDDGNGHGELYALYLTSTDWGKGYGRQLILAVENRLTELGFANFTLWVLEQNARARRFYKRAGYQYDGSRKTIVIDEADLFELRYAKNRSRGYP